MATPKTATNEPQDLNQHQARLAKARRRVLAEIDRYQRLKGKIFVYEWPDARVTFTHNTVTVISKRQQQPKGEPNV